MKDAPYTPPDDLGFEPDPETQMHPADKSSLVGGHVFLGQELKPFCALRRNAVQHMGHKLFCGTADFDEDQFRSDDGKETRATLYPGAISDTILVLYVCSIPDSQVMRVFRRTDESVERAMAWGAKNDIALGTKNFLEATQVVGDLYTEWRDSRFEIDHEGND